MASANFEMQEYPRAIQCWEDLARLSQENLLNHLPMLSKAYARYGDLDSVGGARALQGSTPDVEDQLFYHQVSRQMEVHYYAVVLGLESLFEEINGPKTFPNLQYLYAP